jgi:hypothetical protein
MVYERYADDFVCGFERKEDAERYLEQLRERLAKFGLKLAEAKSGVVRFSRLDRKGSGMFTFLGFEFYWARTRKGFPTVKRRTSKKKFRTALAGMTEWLRKHRCQPLSWLREKLSQKLAGYRNHYGVIGNWQALERYWKAVKKLCWRWLNRRSQRRSYRTQGFEAMWKAWDLPKPHIVEQPYRPMAAR